MRAALLYGQEDVRITDVPDPVRQPGEALLKVRSVGICGSDSHYFLEGGIGVVKVERPVIVGHEFAAEVVDSGGVAGLPPGTLVAVDPARPCGRCEWCLRGHQNLCPNMWFAGAPPHPGGLSEYVTAPIDNLIRVPVTFTADTAALLEPTGVAIHALDLAKLRPLDSVAVLGAGPIGLLLLQVARASGAGDTYVIDPLAYRLSTAEALGATAVSQDVASIEEWTNGRGVDVVLEATNSPEGPAEAAEAVRIGGRVVLVGIPEGDRFELTASVVRRKGLTIKLSRRMGHVYPRAIRMVERGVVKFDLIVTHRFALADAAQAFDIQAHYRDGVIKAVVAEGGGSAADA